MQNEEFKINTKKGEVQLSLPCPSNLAEATSFYGEKIVYTTFKQAWMQKATLAIRNMARHGHEIEIIKNRMMNEWWKEMLIVNRKYKRKAE